MTRDRKIEQPCPFLRLSREQPSLASKKRQWSIKIYRQFLDFPSRLAKVEEVGLYQKWYVCWTQPTRTKAMAMKPKLNYLDVHLHLSALLSLTIPGFYGMGLLAKSLEVDSKKTSFVTSTSWLRSVPGLLLLDRDEPWVQLQRCQNHRNLHQGHWSAGTPYPGFWGS